MRNRPSQPNNFESEDQDNDEDISRREFLKALGAAGAAGAAMYKWGPDIFEYAFENDSKNLRYEGEKLNHNRKKVLAGNLEGATVNDLYKLYIGLSVNTDTDEPMKVPEAIDVDFIQQLTAMWNTKSENEGVNNVAIETGHELIDEYKQLTPNGVSLEDYKDEVDRVTVDMHEQVNWSDVRAKFGLTEKGGNLLKSICRKIGGRELLSYALTELMPSNDGELNKDVLDYMLKNAGREYVERIPAVHDSLTSFGPYQFTANALFQTPEGQRGASQLAEHVSDDSIPGSVSKLRGVDHHQVAYLFATKNLAELIGRLNDDNLATFANGWSNHMDDIAEFIATTHNYPYSTEYSNGGLRAGELWIANDMEHDFEVSTDHKPKEYAKKTKKNYEVLA